MNLSHPRINWKKIKSIRKIGRGPCVCIAVDSPSRLYVTNNGIITHNTSGDPRTTLPQAYVDRAGTIRVLDKTPENERAAAALQASPVDTPPPPRFEDVYRQAPEEIRQSAERIVRKMLNSQADFGDAFMLAPGRYQTLLTTHPAFDGLPIIKNDRRILDDFREMPAFQGNKNWKLKQSLRFFRAAFPDEDAAQIRHIVDGFGGGGSYMQSLILHERKRLSGLESLTIREFNPMRLQKIIYFATRGSEFMKDFRETGLLDAVERFSEGITSAGGLGPRIEKALDSDEEILRIRDKFSKSSKTTEINTADAILSALVDFGKGSFSTKLANGKAYAMLAQDAEDAQWRHQQLTTGPNPIRVEWKGGSSFEDTGIMDRFTLFSADPPYYHTSGYAGAGTFQTQDFWNAKGYEQVYQMLARAKAQGASIIYDDEAWFLRGDAMGIKNPKNTLRDVPEAVAIFEKIRALFPEIAVVPVGNRLETLAVLNNVGTHERGTTFKRTGAQLTDSGYRARNALEIRQGRNEEYESEGEAASGSKPETEGSTSESTPASGSAGTADSVAPTNVLPTNPDAIRMPEKAGSLYDVEYNAGEQASAATIWRNLLPSQSPMQRMDELAARAAKQAGIGDPRLAHSMDNEQWQALDEFRKEIFRSEKESDWQAMAERMLATHYADTRAGLFAKFAARESLLPWETKAAEKIIAAEMAKPLYGTPQADARREMVRTFALGLRESRAQTARTLSAFRDPHRTPQERFRAWAGDVLFTPSDKAQREMDKHPSAAQKSADMEAIRRRIEILKDLASKSQEQAAEITTLRARLAEVENSPTKEDIASEDVGPRMQRVNERLKELGITLDDLLGGQVEVRLMGARIVGDAARQFSNIERQVIALWQTRRGGDSKSIAARMGMKESEVRDIATRFLAVLREEFLTRFRQGIEVDQMDISGIDTVLLSSQDHSKISEAEAIAKTERAMRIAGFSPTLEELEKTTFRERKTRRRRQIPPAKTPLDESLPAWSYPKGEGRPVTDLLDEAKKRGIAWQQAPKGEGRTTSTGKLDLADAAPYEWDSARFDMESTPERIQAMRFLAAAARGATWWDYISEAAVANMLSAPVTAIANMTGYLYGTYRFTFRRAIEAGMNFENDASAATFAEFRPMFSALTRHMGTAFTNALVAWKTETPVTEVLRGNAQQNLGISFDEPLGKIPGKLGRFVRTPMRLLLATDEFAKTLLCHTHAAALAHRLGRMQGYEGKRLERYIAGQLGDATSIIWEKALNEARYVTFQNKLRTFGEMNASDFKGLSAIARLPEGILAQMQHIKNTSGTDAGFVHNAAAFALRIAFPFIKTPYNLLYIGLKESYMGAIVEAVRQRGGIGNSTRVKGELLTTKDSLERQIRVQKLAVKAAKSATERDQAIEALKATRSLLAENQKAIQADPKRGYLHGPKDVQAAVNARATIFTAAILTSLLLAGGEGDDNDDEKPILITGTIPKGDPKQQGARQLAARTIPEQSIRFGGPGGLVISYKRLDPFSTILATTVDTIASLKQGTRDGDYANSLTRIASSIYAQLLDKASLRGFSAAAEYLTGQRELSSGDLTDTAIGYAVPNLIRNLAKNSDSLLRDRDLFGDDWQARLLHSALPLADFAPTARRDLYGRPIEQRGNLITRAFIPGSPSAGDPYAPEDVTLRNWNLRHPADPIAPQADRPREIMDRYSATPRQADAFLAARGRYIANAMREAGLTNLRNPTPEQRDEINKIFSSATAAARKQVFGK